MTDIVLTMYKREICGRWPTEAVNLFTSFQPVGALARVGYVTHYLAFGHLTHYGALWPFCADVPVARAGHLCSGSLLDVPRQAIAEYERSGDVAYAAYQLPTSTGKFIKTAVRLVSPLLSCNMTIHPCVSTLFLLLRRKPLACVASTSWLQLVRNIPLLLERTL